jgi:hypothetical protein
MPATPEPRLSSAIFLSYASQDQGAARRICDALRSGGLEVWFDQEGGLEHGDEWDAKIRRQIRECVFFIPLISGNTQCRLEGYFRIEWDLAAERAQGIAQGVPFILPVTVDNTREADALVPERFRKVQWMHLPGGEVPSDVRARLLKLWSHRTGVLSRQNGGRATTEGPGGHRSAEPRAASALPPAVTKPLDASDRFPLPKSSGRFESLELGGARTEVAQPAVVKDGAYYLTEAHELYAQGRYDLALRAYSKVLEHNAGELEAWTAQVRMLIELSELREARLWADKALQRFPDQPDLLAAKAVGLARMGDLNEALAYSDGAIEQRGNTPYVWLARGDVLLARGEARAAYCFDQAMTVGRRGWLHCWEASRVHLFHRSAALALRFALEASEQAPERAVVWLQVGRCHIALGNGARAREALGHAGQIDPECPGLDRARHDVGRLTAGGSLLRRIRNLWE